MRSRLWAVMLGQSLAILALLALVLAPRGAAAPAAQAPVAALAVETAPLMDVSSQRIGIANPLTLEEARVIIDAAIGYVRENNARAAVAVVDEHGHLISLDRTDGTSQFFGRFAVGKAVGAVALQVPTEVTAEQYHTNPQRFLSALSMLQGEVLLIRGGLPLLDGTRIIGGVGSAGFGPDGDTPAVETGIAAWQRYRAALGR